MLGGRVRVSGLRVKAWRQYGLARLTLSSPRPAAEPILKAEDGVLQTGSGSLQVCEAGIVKGKSRGSLTARLQEIYRGVTDVIQSLSPAVMALEELYSHYQRPRTAILMGHARGVICLAAAEADIPVVSYAATQVKRILTG